ncbi:MAG: nitroreductase family protein [Alphaproteobacteria bacterium]|nr:MAG: nitroreductase family protein [Alphaproteobacteria bacterium]
MSDPSYRPVPLKDFPTFSDAEMIRRAHEFRMLMSRRRTIRQFSDAPVPRAVIEEAVRTAGSAPSGANKQPWHFVVVEDRETKRRIRAAAEEEERRFYAERAGERWLADLAPLGTGPEKPFLETAPYLIACFEERWSVDPETGEKGKNYYVQESVGLACGFLVAALHQAGLATLTHTPSPMGFLREILGRAKHERPVMLIVTGRPAADARVPDITRKPLHEIISWF